MPDPNPKLNLNPRDRTRRPHFPKMSSLKKGLKLKLVLTKIDVQTNTHEVSAVFRQLKSSKFSSISELKEKKDRFDVLLTITQQKQQQGHKNT